MKKLLARFVREEDGQDLVEYAFLLVFIALVVAAGLNLLGFNLLGQYNATAAAVAPGVPVVPAPGT